MSNITSPTGKFSTSRGARRKTVYVERQVKTYAIDDNELKHLSLLNTMTTTCMAFGSGLLSLTASIVIQVMGEPADQPLAKPFLAVAVVFGVLTVAFFLAGVFFIFRRTSTEQEIREQSCEVDR